MVENGINVSILSHLLAYSSVASLYIFEETCIYWNQYFMLSWMVFVPAPHIKVSVRCDCIIAIGMCTKLIQRFSSYLALKIICNTALILLQNKALGMYMELTDAKIWISKNASLW